MPFSRNALHHTVTYTHLEANSPMGGKFLAQELLGSGNDERASSALRLLSPRFVQLVQGSNSQTNDHKPASFSHLNFLNPKMNCAICLVKSFLPTHGIWGFSIEYAFKVNAGFVWLKRSCHICGNGLNIWWQNCPRGKQTLHPCQIIHWQRPLWTPQWAWRDVVATCVL